MECTAARLSELKQKGHRLIGCFPLYPPLELLHSFGLTPVTLWGLSPEAGDSSAGDAHLQNFTCHVARSLTEFVLTEGGGLLCALCMCNACDTLRNLPEILGQGLKAQGMNLPIFKLHVPASDRCGAVAYLDTRITLLIRELEVFTGRTFSPAAFMASCELYRRQRSLAQELGRRVRTGALSYGFSSRILLLAHQLPVRDHIELLEELLSSSDRKTARGGPGIPIMISGILPPPSMLVETMEQAGLLVVADDCAALYRSYGNSPFPVEDPAAYYRDYYFSRVPCPTLLPTSDKRIAHILQTISANSARGFIFCGEKFCEYEYFEFPYLEELLKLQGIGTLSLEMGEHDGQSLGTMKNRIETFAELLGRA